MHLDSHFCAALATLEMIDPLIMSFLCYLKSEHIAPLHRNVNSRWMYVLTALNCASGDNLFAHKSVRATWLTAWKHTGASSNPTSWCHRRDNAPFLWLLSRNIEAFDQHLRIFSAAFLRKPGSYPKDVLRRPKLALIEHCLHSAVFGNTCSFC